MKKIKYIGYYNLENEDRNAPVAGVNVMNYIIKSLKYLKYKVDVISFAMPEINIKSKGKIITVDSQFSVRTFDCFLHKNKYIRFIDRIKFKRKIYKWLLENTSNGEEVLIYHSLAYSDIIKKLKKKRNISIILETNEIYADVRRTSNYSKRREIKYMQLANKYIFATHLLNNIVNPNNKPWIECNGNYNVKNQSVKKFQDGRIHVVYSGTFDYRKGVMVAINLSKVLSENYCVHILGFGSKGEVKKIKNLISSLRLKHKCGLSYEGLKLGDDYINFIQKCDIGLATQNLNESYNETSFPSKILSYMCNGLRVVSVRIPAVEESNIGKFIYYCDNQTPEQIAKKIMSIKLDDKYDSRRVIKKINENFRQELVKLLK